MATVGGSGRYCGQSPVADKPITVDDFLGNFHSPVGQAASAPPADDVDIYFSATVTEVEKQLVAIWEELLELDNVGYLDNLILA